MGVVQLVAVLGVLCWCLAEAQCEEGWTGPECEVAVCDQGCHPVHGNCTRPGQCVCAAGWRGRQCSECVPRAGCQHGSCTDTNDCACHPGWSGPLCTRPLCQKDCHPVHGYCDLPGECKCRTGYTGPNCQECKPLPGCVNGFCTKPLECKCEPGWTGSLCQTPVCADGCSATHGYCTQPGECRCKVGWWGDLCDLCFPYPGCDHGSCDLPWECVCHPGWAGMLCDTPVSEGAFCRSHPSWCLNGGTCIDVAGGRNFTCSCPSLFSGQRCDYLADPTAADPASTSPRIISTGTRNTVQIISPDNSSPLGTYALTQPSANSTPSATDQPKDNSTPSATDQPKDNSTPSATDQPKDEEDPKDARRRLLQKNARISFRQPKLANSEERSGKLPYMVVERKLLPLPVVLPRVSEIIPGGEQVLAHKLNKQQPTPILVLGLGASGNSQDNTQTTRNSIQSATGTSGRNHINENRRFLRHQQDSPGFISNAGERGAKIGNGNGNGPTPPQETHVLVKVLNSQRRPILVSAQARALPRPNPVNPATLRTLHRPRQHSRRPATTPNNKPTSKNRSTTTTSTRPTTRPTTTRSTTKPTTRPTTRSTTKPTTRPTTKPTTRPTTKPTTRPTTEPTTRPTTEPTTRRTSKPTTQLTTRPPINPTTPHTRERFTLTPRPPPSPLQVPTQETASSSFPVSLPLTAALVGGPPTADFEALEGRESIIQTYYDENANGRVHIGDISRVDDGAPHEEIFDAFIELKKV